MAEIPLEEVRGVELPIYLQRRFWFWIFAFVAWVDLALVGELIGQLDTINFLITPQVVYRDLQNNLIVNQPVKESEWLDIGEQPKPQYPIHRVKAKLPVDFTPGDNGIIYFTGGSQPVYVNATTSSIYTSLQCHQGDNKIICQ